LRKLLAIALFFALGGVGALTGEPLLPDPWQQGIAEVQQEVRYSWGIDPLPIDRQRPDPVQVPIARPTQTPTPTLAPSSPSPEAQEIESRFHALVNEARLDSSLGRLSLDPTLSDVARYHSHRMGTLGFFEHDDPTSGLDPTGRGTLFGYSCHKDYGSYTTTGLAENIFMVTGVGFLGGVSPRKEAQRAFDALMASAGHHENIVEPGYDRQGVGVFVHRGSVWVTQDFC
jgi:uncharacterized protein YkwD